MIKIIFSLVIAAILITSTYLHTRTVPAAAQTGILPFGGRIAFVEYCCNGVAINVVGPRPGRFLYTAGSILYAYYNIFAPGPNVVGTALPDGEPCLDPFLECSPIPTLGRIVQVGTSGF